MSPLARFVLFLYRPWGYRVFRFLGPFEGLGPAVLAWLGVALAIVTLGEDSALQFGISLALFLFSILWVALLVITSPERKDPTLPPGASGAANRGGER